MRPLSIVPSKMKQLAHVVFVNSYTREVHASILESLRNQHLDMVFQPIIHHSREEVFAYESLSRPEFRGTSIRPDIWFTVAHEYNHSLETDLLAVNSAIDQSNIKNRHDSTDLLFINVMPSTLFAPSFRTELESFLGLALCQPSRLVLEITEHIAYEPSKMAEKLHAFREIGVRFALDDVGLGASNLASIVELEPDFIKLDRVLIAGISSSTSKQKMLHQLVNYMGDGDRVIAEGIENLDDLAVVKQIGVNLSQGYLWGKPQPFALLPTAQQLFNKPQTTDLIELLEEHPPIDVSRRSNGSVQLQNGTIVVKSPETLGNFPTIEVPADPRLKVTLNGNPVNGRIIVQESDRIIFDTQSIAPASRVFIRESHDSMEVIAVRQITLGERYYVIDKEQTTNLVVEIGTEVVYPEHLDLDSITQLLNGSRYQGEYDTDGIEKICTALETVETVVLRGRHPVPASPDEYIDLDNCHVYDPFHRQMQTSTVTAGTAIATVVKGTPGVPGYTVYGAPIEPPFSPAEPALGEGVTRIGDMLVALRNGRPIIRHDMIDVVPELVIGHNLSSKDGNVDFDGDVVVYGSILDGAYVRSSGTITVHGSILCATVLAERGLFVSGSVVGAHIVAGHSKLLYQKLEAAMRLLSTEYELFRSEYKTLLSHAKKNTDSIFNVDMLASMLIGQRHPTLVSTFEQITKDFNDLTSKEQLFAEMTHEIRVKWLGIQQTKIHEYDVELLRDQLDKVLYRVQSMSSATPANIRVSSITSSIVRATGKIVVKGSGVFTSTLESDDVVLVNGNVRGGFIIARSAVRINQSGTPAGTETAIRVLSENGFIAIRSRHSNTLLQVGKNRHRNFTDENNVMYRGV